ncbi:MAG: metal-binding protein [Cycloclasticus sp. symbiont of Poecilosclerida sp. N]|nr:MAG: metal-binding protein [Cycloclasticus sp. symbiont of Poecilosclerida sp. N]
MIGVDHKYLNVILIFFLMLSLSACADNADIMVVKAKSNKTAMKLDVFKSPTCECCGRWVNHIDSLGFKAVIHHPLDLSGVKQKLGVAPQYQSCHTGVSKEGYIFEGHIPAEVMQRFLAERPKNALGLAVPGMPVGSPGMEMGDRYDSYDVLLLKKDGSSQVYERIRHKG